MQKTQKEEKSTKKSTSHGAYIYYVLSFMSAERERSGELRSAK